MQVDILNIETTDRRLTPLPPTKIYWASGDTVCDQNNGNAVPFSNLLSNSPGCYIEDVDVGAVEHGDPAHFVADEYVSWFLNWN